MIEIKTGDVCLYTDEYDFNHPKEREGKIISISLNSDPPICVESEVGVQYIYDSQIISKIEKG